MDIKPAFKKRRKSSSPDILRQPVWLRDARHDEPGNGSIGVGTERQETGLDSFGYEPKKSRHTCGQRGDPSSPGTASSTAVSAEQRRRTHTRAPRTYSPRAPRPLLALVHGCGPWASTHAKQVCGKCCAREPVEITGERDAKQKQKSREEGEGEADGQRSRRELFPRWPTERSIFHGRGVPPGEEFLGNLVVSRGRAKQRTSWQLHAHSAHGTQPSPFSSVFLSLPPTPPGRRRSVRLARTAIPDRAWHQLTLMMSSISGTSPLLVPFSWLSSAILRVLVRGDDGRRHFCPVAFVGGYLSVSVALVTRTKTRTRPNNERDAMEVREILTQRACRATFTPLAPPAARPPNHVTPRRARNAPDLKTACGSDTRIFAKHLFMLFKIPKNPTLKMRFIRCREL